MGPELLEIQPRDLKFAFEVKQQSSCSVQLFNKSDEYIAFKIKTTSPKRYCVRPNTGVILPRSKCEFIVTMQAQRTAPPDMQLKDKFLIQSTVVPFGSADEDILPSFFSKETGRYIEENKLRVVLVSPPQSPVLQPINGASKLDSANEAPHLNETTALKGSPALKDSPTLKDSPALKEAPALKEIPAFKESPALKEAAALKDIPALKEAAALKDIPALKEAAALQDIPAFKESPARKGDPSFKESPVSEDIAFNGVENLAASQVKEVEELELKLNNLESKLNEADKTIASLREEKSLVLQEKDKLRQEIVRLRRKSPAKVQVGFPFLFVVFMALVGMLIGYKFNQFVRY